jgi:glutaredoxin 3
MQAEIYTKPNCPYCVKAKDLLGKLDIPYTEMIIGTELPGSTTNKNQSYVTREDLINRLPSAKTVPQIWIDGNHIGGYTDLEAAVASGKLAI